MPCISIIVPVYNSMDYLEQCLHSIATQTYTDFECILVDDGSSDSSGAVCDEQVRRDPRFRTFHKTNGGVSSARNFGIQMATGQFIMFCDQDDQYHPQTLETALRFQTQFPGDFIAWAFTQDRAVWDVPIDTLQPETFSSEKLACFYMSHATVGPHLSCCNLMDTFIWNKLFPAAFLKSKKILFDTHYRRGTEDAVFMLLFWEKFFAAYPSAHMVWLPYPLYFWNDSNALSVTKSAFSFEDHIQKQLDFYKLMFVPLQNTFRCPPSDLAPLAHHLQYQLCIGLIYAKKSQQKSSDLWKSTEFKALMSFFHSNHYYTAYYLPLSWHWSWLCRILCRSYQHSRWIYWKFYWLGYYLFCQNWHRI